MWRCKMEDINELLIIGKRRKKCFDMERKTEFWNKKETGLTREERRTKLRELMMRSESGRALLEKEAADALKREKEKSEFRSYTPSETTRKKKIDRELEKRSKISDCLLNMCNNKMLPMDASIFDAEGNDILVLLGKYRGIAFSKPNSDIWIVLGESKLYSEDKARKIIACKNQSK